MEDAGGSNHPPFCVGLARDVVVGIVEVHRDVPGFIGVEYAQRDSADLVVFASIESFDVPDDCLATDDWLTLEDAAHVP